MKTAIIRQYKKKHKRTTLHGIVIFFEIVQYFNLQNIIFVNQKR